MYTIARIFSGPVLLLAGLNHFIMPDVYQSIMPDYLPAHRELVYLSGAAEMLGAAGTMHPRTRRAAGWFLIAVLLAVFPANVYMAMHPARYPDLPGAALILRLPLQALFVFLVYVATIRDRERDPGLA